MSDEQSITELRRTLEQWHEDDLKIANRNKYQNLSYILWAFSLATTGLATSNPHGAVIAIAVIFFIMGFITLGYSTKFKAR